MHTLPGELVAATSSVEAILNRNSAKKVRLYEDAFEFLHSSMRCKEIEKDTGTAPLTQKFDTLLNNTNICPECSDALISSIEYIQSVMQLVRVVKSIRASLTLPYTEYAASYSGAVFWKNRAHLLRPLLTEKATENICEFATWSLTFLEDFLMQSPGQEDNYWTYFQVVGGNFFYLPNNAEARSAAKVLPFVRRIHSGYMLLSGTREKLVSLGAREGNIILKVKPINLNVLDSTIALLKDGVCFTDALSTSIALN